MKKARKLITFILTVVMVMSMSLTVVAADLTIYNTSPGKSYDLYKVFDLSHSEGAYYYTVTPDFEDFFEEEKSSWTDPIKEIEKLETEALSQLAQQILAWAVDDANGVDPVRTIVADAESETVSGLEDGYYLLNPLGAQGASEGNATMFSLGTLSDSDTEITVKAEYPTLTKETNAEEASIGEEITFTLTSKVPDMTGYNRYYFVVNDTLSTGLTFQNISSIKVGDEKLVENTNYDLIQDGNTIKIVFIDFYENHNDDVGDEVEIIYTAELNENATINGDGNDNTASLTYSNDPKFTYSAQTDEWEENADGDEDPSNDPIGETPEVITTTYTTELTINKTNSSGPLSGAAFKIEGKEGTVTNIVKTTGEVYVKDNSGSYYKLIDGTYTTEEPNGEDPDYDSVEQKYRKEIDTAVSLDTTQPGVTAEGFVNSEGVLTFTGLSAGTYTITEIVTPEGYNPIAPITIVISYDEEHNIFSYTQDGGEEKSITNPIVVLNQTGSQLPSTGGIGTTIFYIAGGALVLFAVVLLVTKKRMKDEEHA